MPKSTQLNKLRLLAIGTVLVAVVLTVVLTHRSQNVTFSKCGAYRNDKTVQVGSTKIQAELAKNSDQQQQGLGNRPCIEKNQGMLFVFNKPRRYPFWMKDMRFPIDIVWIGADHKVVGLDVNLQPSTYPDSFEAAKPVQYVLELQANRADSLGLVLGTPINF